MEKNYEQLFDNCLNRLEFDLIKVKGGWTLHDRYGDNTEIEKHTYEATSDIIEALDEYIYAEYIQRLERNFTDNTPNIGGLIEWLDWWRHYKDKTEWERKDYEDLFQEVNALLHPNKIDLNKCDYKTHDLEKVDSIIDRIIKANKI